MRRRVCLQTPLGWRGTEERVVRKIVGMPRINREENPAPPPVPSANVRRMRIDTSSGRAGVFPPQDMNNRDGCMLLDGDLPATRAAQRSRSPNTSPPFHGPASPAERSAALASASRTATVYQNAPGSPLSMPIVISSMVQDWGGVNRSVDTFWQQQRRAELRHLLCKQLGLSTASTTASMVCEKTRQG